jgi:hypothetical protein
MEKAKAYRASREREAAQMGGSSELQAVITEAMARLDTTGKTLNPKS